MVSTGHLICGQNVKENIVLTVFNDTLKACELITHIVCLFIYLYFMYTYYI